MQAKPDNTSALARSTITIRHQYTHEGITHADIIAGFKSYAEALKWLPQVRESQRRQLNLHGGLVLIYNKAGFPW